MTNTHATTAARQAAAHTPCIRILPGNGAAEAYMNLRRLGYAVDPISGRAYRSARDHADLINWHAAARERLRRSVASTDPRDPTPAA